MHENIGPAREDFEVRELIEGATAGLVSTLGRSYTAPRPRSIIGLDPSRGVDQPVPRLTTVKKFAIVSVVVLAVVTVPNVLQIRAGHGEPALVADASSFVHAGPNRRSDGNFLVGAVKRPRSSDGQLSEGILAMRLAGANAIAAASACLGPRTKTSEVKISSEGFTGGSGGLIFALTIVDALGRRDLRRGRDVAGTGTILRDGTVGRVLFVGLKARAAARAGADLFLVPAVQIAEARGAAGSMRVAGVRSLDEAVQLLVGGTGCERSAPRIHG